MKSPAVLLAAFLALMLVPPSYTELQAEVTTLEEVVQMWVDREAATQTARIHWVETLTRRPRDRDTGDLGEPVVQKRDCVLWLGNGPKVRHDAIPSPDSTGPGDSLTRPGLAISAFNGKRNVNYTAAIGPDDHHRGILFDAEIYDELVNYHLRAVILSYRPLLVVRSQFSAQQGGLIEHDATLRIVECDAMLAGRPCVVIESTAADAPVNFTDRYWVDVARGGLILKHVESAGGQESAQLTIDYNITPEFGWVPASWKARYLSGRTLFSGVVLDFTLNEQLPADTFEIAYPPGTVVFDQDRSERWRMLPNGTKQVIRPEAQER